MSSNKPEIDAVKLIALWTKQISDVQRKKIARLIKIYKNEKDLRNLLNLRKPIEIALRNRECFKKEVEEIRKFNDKILMLKYLFVQKAELDMPFPRIPHDIGQIKVGFLLQIDSTYLPIEACEKIKMLKYKVVTNRIPWKDYCFLYICDKELSLAACKKAIETAKEEHMKKSANEQLELCRLYCTMEFGQQPETLYVDELKGTHTRGIFGL